MNVFKYSAIARPLDFKYATNRALTLVVAFLFLGGWLHLFYMGIDLWTAASGSGWLSLTVFLAWALGRELDPDHDGSAFLAMGFALAGTVALGVPSAAAGFWLLLSTRVLNRTKGRAATPLDSMIVLMLGAWLSFVVQWIFCLLTAAVFLMDGVVKRPLRRQFAFAALSVFVAVTALMNGGLGIGHLGLSWAAGAVALLLYLPFAPLVLSGAEVSSVGDDTNERLSGKRVRAGQVLALLSGVTVALLMGSQGLAMLLPLWAALLGASAWLLVRFVRISSRSPSRPPNV